MSSAVARDSFAFVDWYAVPILRVMDVSIPSRPVMAGGVDLFNPPDDMIIRDSFVYCAEVNRFQVVNIARPREPVLAGSCVAGDANRAGLCVDDTLAYVGNFVSDVVDIRNPASPQVISHFDRGASNIAVRDTFAFVASGKNRDTSLFIDRPQPMAMLQVCLG
jgi:hypothetical protein